MYVGFYLSCLVKALMLAMLPKNRYGKVRYLGEKRATAGHFSLLQMPFRPKTAEHLQGAHLLKPINARSVLLRLLLFLV